MSRCYPTPFEVTKLSYICRYCGAAPGVWCTSPSNRWTGYLHSDRFYQARPCTWRPAGTDFPRDSAAQIRLARLIGSGVA